MTFIKLGKKALKISGIIFGILVIILALFYWWFVNHAERAIEDIVSIQSKGKLKVEIGKLRYNYGKKLSLQDINFYSIDTTNGRMGYNFHIRNLRLTVRSIRSLLLDKQLLIDSILIQSPAITITRLQKTEQIHMSVPEEMGKIYETIEKALSVLEIKRFQIDDARLTLLDKTDSSLQPLSISRLHFHVDNFKVDTSEHKQRDKFLFADNVALRSDHQSFMLPDGKHHIAFKNFSIDIRKQAVEMDSCTITAYRHHGSRPAFRMFVDTMRLTNVDFLALSRHGLIRADSVYLVNSKIRLLIEEDSIALRRKKKGPVNFQQVLGNLVSDMQLAYIGVKNSDIDVTTEKDSRVNTFSSSGNNFELYKVVVDTKSEKPINVEKFLMAIRNYEGYGKDSAFRYRFDSIRFTNNTVLLNNFTINTAPGASIDAQRHYSMPLFELKGLSWQDLIFNRHIAAREAVLHNPVLHYEKQRSRDTSDRRSIYELFTILDTLINLQRISMMNGTLDFKLNSNTRITLDNVNGSVNTNRLLAATSSGFIESSVESLSFSKGAVTTPHLNIKMDRAYFEGRGRSLVIRSFNLHSKKGDIHLTAEDLALQDLLLNDSVQLLRIDHISWKKGKAAIDWKKASDSSGATLPPLKLFVNGIQLNNTDLDFKSGNQTIRTFIRQASANSIIKEPGEVLQLNQLHLQGDRLQYAHEGTAALIGNYQIREGQPSFLRQIQVLHYADKDSLSFSAPSLQLTPFIESLGKGTIRINQVVLTGPEAKIIQHRHTKTKIPEQIPWPDLEIDALVILQPTIDFRSIKDSGTTELTLTPASLSDKLTFTDIRTTNKPGNQLQIGSAGINISNFQVQTGAKDSSSIIAQQLSLTADHLLIQQASQIDATAFIRHVSTKGFHQYNQTKGSILHADSLSAAALHFNNSWLKEPTLFFKNSPALTLHHFSGYHKNRNDQFSWQNLRYDRTQKQLNLDSFTYSPTLTREQFIASHPFQTDHIQAWTGPVAMTGIEPLLFFHDSTLKVQAISIQHPVIEVFRDKRPPFQHGIYKPLPTGLIKKIPFPFSIDTIHLHNMTAQYSELSDKTHQTGVVRFTGLQAQLFPVKNIDLHDSDSLRLRAKAMFLDSISLAVNMDESYADSLHGFLFEVHMSPTQLPRLNPVLEPLASIKVRKGELDTMIMKAVGRDYLSLGEMQMYYRNLNIQFLKNGIEEKTTFLTRLITWAANHIVLRNNNTKRTGTIYFNRLRDRSIFNYWVKMTLSGAASSVGVKKNKKYLKRYHKALRKNELPPIDQFQ